MEISLKLEPEQSDIEEIRAGLRKNNAPYLENIFHLEFMCHVDDENGSKIGGLIGEIWGKWLVINFLWVDEQHKGKGIGSQLLRQAEQLAFDKGCHSSLLDTFSFQAQPFYMRHGYKTQMTLEKFPISSQRHYMTKQLEAHS